MVVAFRKYILCMVNISSQLILCCLELKRANLNWLLQPNSQYLDILEALLQHLSSWTSMSFVQLHIWICQIFVLNIIF